MITKLHLKNFKSHRDTSLDLKPFTLISGVNNIGKSSVLQAILLLRQSFKKGRLTEGLDLNKPLVNIGVGNDALYRLAQDPSSSLFPYRLCESPLVKRCQSSSKSLNGYF